MRLKTFLVSCTYILLLISNLKISHAHDFTHNRLDKLNHSIEHNSKDPTLFVKRGNVYHESGQWDDAINDYLRALQIDSTYYEALYQQGSALLQKGNYQQARRVLDKYLNKAPNSSLGHRTIAKVYSKNGNYLQAAKHYDQSILYDQNTSPQVYLERVRTLMKIKPIPKKRINTGLLEALKKHGMLINLLELVIALNLETKNYQQANTWIAKLPTKLKDSPHWLIKKAEVKVLQGYHKAARKLYILAIKTIDELPDYRQNTPAFVYTRIKAEKGLVNHE